MKKQVEKKAEKTAFYKTKIGKLKVCYTDEALTYVKFAKSDDNIRKSERSELSDKAIEQINEYLEGKRQKFDLPILLQGTDFQKKVWRELQKIPYGKTKSYKEIAQAIKNPKAVRAVGMANNKNPITIIVPCHRVIGSNGDLVGYAGGLDVKKTLLQLEQK